MICYFCGTRETGSDFRMVCHNKACIFDYTINRGEPPMQQPKAHMHIMYDPVNGGSH